jgi:hypothetical protein
VQTISLSATMISRERRISFRFVGFASCGIGTQTAPMVWWWSVSGPGSQDWPPQAGVSLCPRTAVSRW